MRRFSSIKSIKKIAQKSDLLKIQNHSEAENKRATIYGGKKMEEIRKKRAIATSIYYRKDVMQTN